MQRKIIIDANCMCYRAYFAMGGEPEGIIFNVINQILTLSKFLSSNNLIFCWDSRGSIRRNMYPTYKANRSKDKTPEELENKRLMYIEFDKVMNDVIPMLGFKNSFKFEGYEADDIAAYIAIESNNKDNVLVTTDEDYYQLLGYAKIWNPNKRTFITRRTFWRKYGIPTWKWSWVKAYAGCSSDNIKGIYGIGEATAIDYINEKLKPKSKRFKDITSEEGQDIYKANIKLVTLPLEGMPEIEIVKDDLKMNNFKDVCIKYKLKKLMSRVSDWSDLTFRGE